MRDLSRLLVVVVLGVAIAGCRKKPAPPPTPLALKPAAEARKDLVVEFVFPSLQRTMTSAGQVAQRLGLPFSAQDSLKTLATRAGLPQGAVDRIDLGKAIAVTAVVTGEAVAAKGSTAPVIAFALRDRSPAGFEAFVAASGKTGQRVQDAVKLDRGDAGEPKEFWLLPRDGAVCAGASQALLQAACALAIAARKAHAEDVRVTLVPDALARANGTTVAEALGKVRRQIAEEQAKAQQQTPAPPPGAGQMVEGMTGYFLNHAADVAELRVLLALDESKGLTSTAEAQPRPGSRLGQLLASSKPYTVDPALLGQPPPGAIYALGDLALYRELAQLFQPMMLGPSPTEKDTLALQQSLDTLFAGLAGPATVRFDAPPGDKLAFRYDVSYALKPGTDPRALLDAFEKLVAGPWTKRLLESAGTGLKVKLTASRQRGKPADTVVVRMSVDPRSLPPEMKGKTRGIPLLDGRPIEARAAVAGDRLLLAIGEDARAALPILMARTPAEPSGEVAAALAETQGDASVFFADLAAVLRPAMTMALGQAEASGAAPPLLAQVEQIASSLRLGMWGSHRGGSTLTLRWRLPMTTMESAGTAVRAFMGMRGAGPPAQ